MRVIEQNMVQAIKNQRKRWASGNTQVHQASDGWQVYLHGNLIAVLYPRGLSFTLAGWNTVTTRSRVNALLGAFAHDRVFQKNFTPYISQGLGEARKLSPDEWVNMGEVPA